MGWGSGKSSDPKSDKPGWATGKPKKEHKQKGGWGSGQSRSRLRRESGRTLSGLARKAGVKLIVDPVTGKINNMGAVKAIRGAAERLKREECPQCGKKMPKSSKYPFHSSCARDAALEGLSGGDSDRMADKLD